MPIFWNFLRDWKSKKNNENLQHIYLDIDELQIKNNHKEKDKTENIVIIDIFSNEK